MGAGAAPLAAAGEGSASVVCGGRTELGVEDGYAPPDGWTGHGVLDESSQVKLHREVDEETCSLAAEFAAEMASFRSQVARMCDARGPAPVKDLVLLRLSRPAPLS